MIRSWLVKKVLTNLFGRLNNGDYRLLMKLYTDDVHFVFPGSNSWACDVRGKQAVGAWLQQVVDIGLQFALEEVVVTGPLWRSTIVVRSTDSLHRGGEQLYHNRYVLWMTTRWLKVADYEAYEDTEKATALNKRLAADGIVVTPQPAA